MTSITQSAPGRGAAWAVLIGMGVTSVTYNVFHAVHGAHLEVALALLLGFAPAYATAFLSHVVAVLDAPWWIKTAVIVVVLGGMVLSAGATATVVSPAEPGWKGWLFGGVLDASALLALWAILEGGRRKAAAEAVLEAARITAAEAVSDAGQARSKAAEATADRDRLAAELAAAGTEMETAVNAVRAELEAELQRLRSALTDALTKTPNRRRGSAPNRSRSSVSAKRSGSGMAADVPRDLNTQAEALKILAEEPGISGQELGRRLGKSESYGCRLKNRLAPSVPGPDQTSE